MSEPARLNIPEWTVSELAAALRRTVEDAFGHVRVRGEISGYRGPHSSGHCYFALKDDSAKIEAVIWRSAFARLRMKPEEGLEVFVTGRAKELIIVNGRNYLPQLIERVAEGVAGVRAGNVAAFSVPGEDTERVVLACETRAESNDAVRSEVRRRLERDLGVAGVTVVIVPAGSIPKTTSGKLQRGKVRALYLSGALPSADGPPEGEVSR